MVCPNGYIDMYGVRLGAPVGSSVVIVVGADVVGCVVWAGVNDIWTRGVLHVFIKAAHESCQITPIPQRHFSFFSHNLLKKGSESDPTCRDFGVLHR